MRTLIGDAAHDFYRSKPIDVVYLLVIAIAIGVAWQLSRIVNAEYTEWRERRRSRTPNESGRLRLP